MAELESAGREAFMDSPKVGDRVAWLEADPKVNKLRLRRGVVEQFPWNPYTPCTAPLSTYSVRVRTAGEAFVIPSVILFPDLPLEITP